MVSSQWIYGIGSAAVAMLAMYFVMVVPLNMEVALAKQSAAQSKKDKQQCELSIVSAKLAEKNVEMSVTTEVGKATEVYRDVVRTIPKYVNVPVQACDGAKATLLESLKGETK